jgi:hypothetical protein
MFTICSQIKRLFGLIDGSPNFRARQRSTQKNVLRDGNENKERTHTSEGGKATEQEQARGRRQGFFGTPEEQTATDYPKESQGEIKPKPSYTNPRATF